MEATDKLISVRRYFFVRGILGQRPDSGFRRAFRTLNRLYVEVRVGKQFWLRKPLVVRRKAA